MLNADVPRAIARLTKWTWTLLSMIGNDRRKDRIDVDRSIDEALIL
jgi:hypothetical protein